MTHAEILEKANRLSPTGFRRRRESMRIPKGFDFGERAEQVLSDQVDGPLSIEQEKK